MTPPVPPASGASASPRPWRACSMPPRSGSTRRGSRPPARTPTRSWPGRSGRRGSASTRRAARPFPASALAAFDGLVARRARHEPLQYLLGGTEFCGLALAVGPGVFIPRPETEELVDRALALGPTPAATVLDLCAGSGALACALAVRRPELAGLGRRAGARGGGLGARERPAAGPRRARPGARGRSLGAACRPRPARRGGSGRGQSPVSRRAAPAGAARRGARLGAARRARWRERTVSS